MFWLMAKLLQGLSAVVFLGLGIVYTLGVLSMSRGERFAVEGLPYQPRGELGGVETLILIVVGWITAAVMAGVIAFVGLGIQYFAGGIRNQARL